MADSLLILGAGGHGRSIYELAQLSGSFAKINYLDDSINPSENISRRVIGRIKQLGEYASNYSHAIVGIGNNKLREELQYKIIEYGVKPATLIHPKAIVSPSARIERGSVIFAGAIIGIEVRVGQGVIINCNSVVDHDGVLEDFSHLGVGVNLAGNSLIGRSAFVQAGSSGGYSSHLESFATCAPGTVLKTRA